jgi:hypothetical protein
MFWKDHSANISEVRNTKHFLNYKKSIIKNFDEKKFVFELLHKILKEKISTIGLVKGLRNTPLILSVCPYGRLPA